MGILVDSYNRLYKKAEGEYDEPKKDNPLGSLALPIGAGAATGVAAKGFHDISKINNQFQNWNKTLTADRTKIDQALASGARQFSPEQAQQFIDNYINGARGITQSKILGVRAGNIGLANIRKGVILSRLKEHFGWHLKNRSPIQGIKDIPKVVTDIKERLGKDYSANHYKLYTNPNITLNDLRKHHIEEGFNANGPWSSEFLKSTDLPEDDLFLKKLMNKYRATFGREKYDAIKKTLLANTKSLEGAGTVLQMLGNGRSTVLGTARAYHQTIPPILKKVLSMRAPLLLGGAALTAASGYHAYDKLKNKQADDNDLIADVGASLGVGAGVGSTMKGVNTALNPSRNIAVTYGKMNPEYGSWDIGSGHSNPGDALFELLQQSQKQDPSLKKFNLSKIVRSPSGIVDPKQLKDSYNLIADTGLGHFADYNNPDMNAGKKQHGEFFDHSNARPYESRVGIMTDMLHSTDHSMSGSTFNGLGKGDYALYYGADSPQLEGLKARGVTPIKTNKTFTPLIKNDALATARDTTSKEVMLDNLVKDRPELADKLKDLHGKKIITISGSGRGDFVAQRALEISDELERRGIKNVKILALTAGSGTNPAIQLALKNEPHIIPIHGKLPANTFVGLQRIADVHMGSTGTSSLTEAMMQAGGQNVVPDVWGHEYGHYIPGSIADRWKEVLPTKDVSTDHWNRGNREFAASMPGGLHLEDNPSKIVDLIQNDAALAKSKVDAYHRANMVNADIDEGRKAMPKAIFDIAKKNVTKQRLRGLAGTIAGLGLTGGSIAAWLAHEKYKKKHTKIARSMELKELIKAKKMSDQKDYTHKNEVLRALLDKNPKAFKVDSHLNSGYVGLTHIKSGFKIHAPKSIVPSSLIHPDL